MYSVKKNSFFGLTVHKRIGGSVFNQSNPFINRLKDGLSRLCYPKRVMCTLSFLTSWVRIGHIFRTFMPRSDPNLTWSVATPNYSSRYLRRWEIDGLAIPSLSDWNLLWLYNIIGGRISSLFQKSFLKGVT